MKSTSVGERYGNIPARKVGGSVSRIDRSAKCRWTLLDREEGRLRTELRLLPRAATGAAECSGSAAESIALLDAPAPDIEPHRTSSF